MDVNRNPFWLLGVSLDDSAETVDERIEELQDDEPERDWAEIGRRLSTPLERIRCEVAWLPGLDADQARISATASLAGERVAIAARYALADMNLRIMRLGHRLWKPAELSEQLVGVAATWDRVDAVAVAQQINAHRQQCGYRARATDERVRTALDEHQSWMNATVWHEVDRLPTEEVVTMFVTLSHTATRSGSQRAPEAVREWIKKYESECQRQLVGQKAEVETRAKNALAALQYGKIGEAKKITEQLCQALQAWDSIAQPIQMMYQGEGTTDPGTEDMFQVVRGFGLSLHNQYGETVLAARVVRTMSQVFKEAARQSQRLEQDRQTLTRELGKKATYPSISPLVKLLMTVLPFLVIFGLGAIISATIRILLDLVF